MRREPMIERDHAQRLIHPGNIIHDVAGYAVFYNLRERSDPKSMPAASK
jgi:hypothetical protein